MKRILFFGAALATFAAFFVGSYRIASRRVERTRPAPLPAERSAVLEKDVRPHAPSRFAPGAAKSRGAEEAPASPHPHEGPVANGSASDDRAARITRRVTRGSSRGAPRTATVPRIRTDDRSRPAQLIDPDLRRQLEDAGIDSAAIDAAELRLQIQRAILDQGGDPGMQPEPEPEPEPEKAAGDSSDRELEKAEETDAPSARPGGRTSVTLSQIREDMPAGRAGLVDGDQLLSYDGHEVYDIPSLRSAIWKAPVDTTVAATVLRNGQEFQVWLEPGVLGARMQQIPSNR